MYRILMVLCALAVVVGLSVSGCGSGGSADELKVWDWHSADVSAGIGKWIAATEEQFKAAHPGLKLVRVAQPHDQYYQVFRAAAAAREGPDVLMVHQGALLFEQKPFLTPLDGYITPEMRKRTLGWNYTTDPDGKTWAVPLAVQGLAVYYNKKLLHDAGVNTDRAPDTWPAFLAACDAVKKAGHAPVAFSGKDSPVCFMDMAYFQTFAEGDREALLAGKMKWTDPKILALVTRLVELRDRGCFQPGYMSTGMFPQVGELFAGGKAAFCIGLISDTVHWKQFGDALGADTVGVMTCPVFQDSPRARTMPLAGASAYGVTSWCKKPAEAFDYIATLSADKNVPAFISEVGSFPANQNYDRSLLAAPAARTIAGWLGDGRVAPTISDALSSAMQDAWAREMARVLDGATTPEKALDALDAEAAAERGRK